MIWTKQGEKKTKKTTNPTVNHSQMNAALMQRNKKKSSKVKMPRCQGSRNLQMFLLLSIWLWGIEHSPPILAISWSLDEYAVRLKMPTNQLRKKTVCTLYALIYKDIYTSMYICVYIHTSVYCIYWTCVCLCVFVCYSLIIHKKFVSVSLWLVIKGNQIPLKLARCH